MWVWRVPESMWGTASLALVGELVVPSLLSQLSNDPLGNPGLLRASCPEEETKKPLTYLPLMWSSCFGVAPAQIRDSSWG